MGVPPTMTSYRGVPINHNVTIYSDDSCMGVPPTPTMTSYGGYLSIIMLLYIAMTHAWAYPPPTMTSYGRYLSIIMLLFIAMTHAGCGLKLCTVTINSGDVPHPPHMFGHVPPPCQSNPV